MVFCRVGDLGDVLVFFFFFFFGVGEEDGSGVEGGLKGGGTLSIGYASFYEGTVGAL